MVEEVVVDVEVEVGVVGVVVEEGWSREHRS